MAQVKPQGTLDAGDVEPKAPYAVCSKCPYKDKSFAKTTGPANAKLAIVSRSPGYNEAMQGKSFAGPAGKVLDHLLNTQGVKREDVIVTNVVLCESPGPEDKGWDLAVSCCAPRLEADIAECDTIIAAGTEAAKAIVSDFTTIGASRGYVHHEVHQASGKAQRLIVTNNPVMVIRDDGTFPELERDFRLAINPREKPALPTVRYIDNIVEAKAAAKEMLSVFMNTPQLLVSSDLETRGSDDSKNSGLKHTAEIVCAGFSIRPERAVVFGERPCYDDDFVQNFLRPLYCIEGARYLWHNGKYDVKVLRTYGIPARVDEDSMLLSWALDERPGDPESGAGGHSLEWLLKDELGWPKYEPYSVKEFKKTGVIPSEAARKQLYEYNGFDTAGALGLFDSLTERAKRDGVFDRPYKSMLIRLSEALTRAELEGNLFDDEVAADILEHEVWPTLRDLKKKAREISGMPELNLNSPLQTSKLFYDDWGLTHGLRRPKIESKGKRSSDHAVREEIINDNFQVNPNVSRDLVIDFAKTFDLYKSLEKQRGTYFEGLILRRQPNGRIYTDFKIHGTESGRLSSSNPNMQNVTRPKAGIPSIRQAFLADPGCTLVSADLSQAELRAIAFLSGDENLRGIYLDTSRSLHKEVATQFYGDNYTYEQYVRAKNINFSAVYWISAHSLTQYYGVPKDEAQPFIDFWWERFPKVWDWTKSIEKQVLEHGELQSPFGHKRRFYVIPADYSGKMHIVKEGINFLPQNIAGNITLWAFIRLSEDLDWEKAQLRINVHDNIVLNVRDEFVDEIADMTQRYMEAAVKEAIGWDFPFLAEVTIGKNWGNLKEWESGKRV